MTKAEKERLNWLEEYAREACWYSDKINKHFGVASAEGRVALREWCIADEFVKFMETGTSLYLEGKFYDMIYTLGKKAQEEPWQE